MATPQGPALSDAFVRHVIGPVGPMDSVAQSVDARLAECGGDREQVEREITKKYLRLAGVGGFATGLGGLLVMAVALPANVAGFYALAVRAVASIAHVRGHDLDDDAVRATILVSTMGDGALSHLKASGLSVSSFAAQVAMNQLPAPVATLVNKGLAFHIAGRVGSSALSRFGRVVPLVGGAVGAGADVYQLRKIISTARKLFVDVEGPPLSV